MKIQITESQFSKILIELRSHHETNVDLSLKEFLDNLLSKYPVDNIFVSFRSDVYVTDINPRNNYETPTGFYAYPLKYYLDTHQSRLDNNHWSEQSFRDMFPYQSELPYIFFFIINDSRSILTPNTPIDVLNEYVHKIKKLFSSNDKILDLCDSFLSGNYSSSYTSDVMSKTHELWLLLYDIGYFYKERIRPNYAFTFICKRIGIDGFVDYGSGYIHPNEPAQGVFFKVKTLGKSYYYKTKLNNNSTIMRSITRLNNENDKINNIINYIKKKPELSSYEVASLIGLVSDSTPVVEYIMNNRRNLLSQDFFTMLIKYVKNKDEICDRAIRLYRNNLSRSLIETILEETKNRINMSYKILDALGNDISLDKVSPIIYYTGGNVDIIKKILSVNGYNFRMVRVRNLYLNYMYNIKEYDELILNNDNNTLLGDDILPILTYTENIQGFIDHIKNSETYSKYLMSSLTEINKNFIEHDQEKKEIILNFALDIIENLSKSNESDEGLYPRTLMFILKHIENKNKVFKMIYDFGYLPVFKNLNHYYYNDIINPMDSGSNDIIKFIIDIKNDIGDLDIRELLDLSVNRTRTLNLLVNKFKDNFTLERWLFLLKLRYNGLNKTIIYDTIKQNNSLLDSIKNLDKPSKSYISSVSNDPSVSEFFKEIENIETNNLTEEIFNYNDLSDQEQHRIFNMFKNSYEKSTGMSWDVYKFNNRASNWVFLGDKNEGYVTLRKQNSGLLKLTGVAGSINGIMKGMNDLSKLNEPIWGMMDDKLANILEKRYGFIRPKPWLIKNLIKYIPSNVFGDVNFDINDDGSITLHYQDVGDATKYFVANKPYYKFLIKNSFNRIPSLILKVIEKMIE